MSSAHEHTHTRADSNFEPWLREEEDPAAEMRKIGRIHGRGLVPKMKQTFIGSSSE